MVVDDVQFMTLLKGKRIKLTLKTSSFIGVVQRINPNRTLVLSDVSSSNGLKITGTKLFFGNEILNVEFADETDVDSGKKNDNGSEEQLNVETFQPYRTKITWDDKDEEEFVNFVVIDEFYQKFIPAVMHIKKQHMIGVGGDGVEIYKNGRLCWLQIATKNKVYLFDILLLGVRAFKNGLSMILESKSILKVIHDCRALAGCLIAQFGVKLTNVFDTQVADVMFFYSETGGFLPDRVSTLQEMVSLHLKVPSFRLSALQMKSQLTKEEMDVWYKRPCPVPLLKVMALSVIHLLPLRLVLLDALMKDYMVLVDSYLSSKHYEPDQLEHISMESTLELPEELRQLKKMYNERQEQARGCYPITEQGLLARFNPHALSKSQTSPDALTDGLFEPGAVEPPSSPQKEPIGNQETTCPSSVTSTSSVDPHTSFDVFAESVPPPTFDLFAESVPPPTVSSFKKEFSSTEPLSEDVHGGCKEPQMDLTGRGLWLGKERSSLPTLPSIGRGVALQAPPLQISRESAGIFKSPNNQEMAPKGASFTLTKEIPQPECHDNELSKDTSGSEKPTPQSLSSLIQSFQSFMR